MKKLLKGSLLKFIPSAIAITLIYGAMYAVVQQTYRGGANDPQIQYVSDIKEILESGQAGPEDIVGQNKVDVSKSLATFIIVFDKDKKAAASSAKLGEGIPIPPSGSFDASSNKVRLFLLNKLFGVNQDENRFTWAPKKDVRIAAVLAKYKDGYVLVGRSMREIETRILVLGLSIIIAWVITLAATFISIVTIQHFKSKSKKSNN